MNTSAITATGLRRTYGSGSSSFEAVRGVDLDIRRGELFALLGTNGAGKTSTLEVLEGLAPPSAGHVRVLGHDPYRDRGIVRPRTGIMLQDAGFPPELTAAETARTWHGTLSWPIPVEQALTAVGLEHRTGVRVSSLSGGERRRLDLALALMGRPEVLFLDEPTTGLDPQSRRNTWDLVTDLLHDGVTVMLTTHYLEEAEALADRLAIMHAGRIARTGTVAEIVAAETARITFTADDDAARLELAALPDLAAAPVRERGTWTLASTNLQATLTALLTEAARADVALGQLEARSATLEQVFLAVAADDATANAPADALAAA